MSFLEDISAGSVDLTEGAHVRSVKEHEGGLGSTTFNASNNHFRHLEADCLRKNIEILLGHVLIIKKYWNLYLSIDKMKETSFWIFKKRRKIQQDAVMPFQFNRTPWNYIKNNGVQNKYLDKAVSCLSLPEAVNSS